MVRKVAQQTREAVARKARIAAVRVAPHMHRAEHVATLTVAMSVAFQVHVIEVLASGVLGVVVLVAMFVVREEGPHA